MKVAELEGALLDYWVGKAEGLLSEYNPFEPEVGALAFDDRIGTQVRVMGQDGYSFWKLYKPSSDWAQGGSIINRKQIQITPQGGYWVATVFLMVYGHQPKYFDAPTPLVASMRAYVASKFGDEVKDSEPKLLD